jgi:hypothetical protein
MKQYFLLIGVLLSFLCKAQNIKGTISCNNEIVPFATITVKNSKTNAVLGYTFSDEHGFYDLTLVKQNVDLNIEVQSMIHEPYTQNVVVDDKLKRVQLDINLIERITILKEVLVPIKEKPIRKKGDTITFDLNKFKNGNERVVQDIIKNLPGMKVDDKGNISFKGRAIKKMLLDGDDLFDSQYTIGSKNISSSMIESVQAIEHFNENKLLHGINDSKDVALNLKLKKDIVDYSGNLNLGYAYEDKKLINGVVLQVSATMKSFLTASYNNVGNNFSPYDYKSSITSIETLKDSDFHANELLNQGSLYSVLDDKYHNINNNFYSSLNSVASLSKDTKLKFNFDFYKDKLKRINETETIYNINNESIKVSTTENITKSPILYNLGYQLSHSFSDSLQFEYIGKIELQKLNLQESTANNSNNQENTTQTEKVFIKQILNLNKRINKNSALLSSLFFSTDSAPQKFVLYPGFDLSNQGINGNITQNIQNSKFTKQFLNLKTEYVFKRRSLILKSSANYNYTGNNLQTSLIQLNYNIVENLNSQFQNNSDYNISTTSFTSEFSYIKSNYEFRGGFTGKFLKIKTEDNIRNTHLINDQFLFIPNISAKFDLNRKSFISIEYKLNQTALNEANFFKGLVLVNFRNLINNDPSFNILKGQQFNISYQYDDLFLFQKANLNFSYKINNNNFFSKLFVEEDYNLTSSFLLDSKSRNLIFGISLDKYIDFIRTGFKFDSSYIVTFGKNIVNDSELRSIEGRNLDLSLTLIPKMGFHSFYIDNKSTITSSSFYLDSNLSNKIIGFKNSTKLLIKFNDRLKSETSCNMLIQDLRQNNKITLLDSELTYISKSKKINYSLIGRNLTNVKMFTTFNVSDFFTSSFSHSLFSRFILGSVSFEL